jgi:hypothetical protein
MNRLCLATLLGVLSSLGLHAEKVEAMAQAPRHSQPMPLPRDGEAAIREEFEAARRTGTREAYELFIARHPQHALAAAARQERDRLPAR